MLYVCVYMFAPFECISNFSYISSCSSPKVGMFSVFISVIRTENFFSLWKGVSPVSNIFLFAAFSIITVIIHPLCISMLALSKVEQISENMFTW